MIRPAWYVCIYFGVRVLCGLALLKAAAQWLSLDEFGQFAQLGIFAALFNFLLVGAMQNGLVRATAAADQQASLGPIHATAFVVWLAIAGVLLCLLTPFAGGIAVVLTGSAGDAGAIRAILFICLLTAPGQIWCGILTGQNRVGAALLSQAAGLLVGTGGSLLAVMQGEPAMAVELMAAGGFITALAAFSLVRPFTLPGAIGRPDRALIWTLCRFAFVTASTVAMTNSTLFGLRAYYRDIAGTDALSHWLAASRISDMSTQFIGLGMAQIILPLLVGATSGDRQRHIMLRAGIAGTLVTVSALLIFVIGSRPLTNAILSPAFISAIPVITVYLAGDCLRVWVSLAQHANLAHDKLGHYAAVELASAGAMAAIMMSLLFAGDDRAPQLAYVGAQALVAIGAVTLLFKARAGSGIAPVRAETA